MIVVMDPNPSGSEFLFVVLSLSWCPASYSHLYLLPSPLHHPQFLGKKGDRTLFSIKARSIVKIKDLSAMPKEDELLMLPATPLVVKACLNMGNGLTMIQVGGDVGFTFTLAVTLILALTLFSLCLLF